MGVRRALTKASVGKRCFYCRRTMLSSSYNTDPNPIIRGLSTTAEHVQCRAHGGGNESTNLVPACSRCNNLRGHLNYDIFSTFARHVLQEYPNAPTVYLRGSLYRFVTSLAEIAIRNKAETNRALSHALLTLGDDLTRSGDITHNPHRKT